MMFLLGRIALFLFILCCGALALEFGSYDPVEIEGKLGIIAPFLNSIANCYLFTFYAFGPPLAAVMIYDKICYGSVSTCCKYC